MSPSCESTDPKPSSDIGTPSGEPQPTNLSVHAGKWGNLTFESARQRYVGHTRGPQRNGLLEPRNLVLGVNGRIGSLCDCLRRSAAECSRGLPAFSRSDKDMIALELGSAVVLIMLLAEQCNIDLPLAVLRKIELNAKKYPAALVRGSALKYDAYREHTGFDRDVKQVTTEGSDGQAHLEGHVEREWTNLTFQDLRQHLQAFAQERGWDKFHTPRNICMALSGEVGELCEVFQWRDEEKCCAGLPGWTSEARDNLAQEISDVCIYLCRLSDLCDVDLTDALLDTRTLRFL